MAHRITGSTTSDLYDAWGNLLARAGITPTGEPFGFGAQFGDYTDPETGLLTHRYYDPAWGRFVTRDPAGFGGA